MATWLKLTSQTAIITGAASGIGRATAIALAEQGCNLLLADSHEEKLEDVSVECQKAANNDILVKTSHCNVTDKSQVQAAIICADELAANAKLSSSSSVASILVNCAGITRDSRVSNLSDEDWDDVLDVNLKGTFLTCRAFCEPSRLNSLLLGGSSGDTKNPMGIGGSIINIGSIVSSYGNIGQVNYAASKGGVVGLTRALAKEMASMSWKATNAVDNFGDKDADDNQKIISPMVRVNCIQPGFIHTPMAAAVPDKILADMTRKIAMQRLGKADDVANLALFLASSERSGYITGENFECSGMLRL